MLVFICKSLMWHRLFLNKTGNKSIGETCVTSHSSLEDCRESSVAVWKDALGKMVQFVCLFFFLI